MFQYVRFALWLYCITVYSTWKRFHTGSVWIWIEYLLCSDGWYWKERKGGITAWIREMKRRYKYERNEDNTTQWQFKTVGNYHMTQLYIYMFYNRLNVMQLCETNTDKSACYFNTGSNDRLNHSRQTCSCQSKTTRDVSQMVPSIPMSPG
jgi:hypothetical protein